MSSDANPASTAAVELGLQLKAERNRERPGKPKGYSKREIPRNICSDRTLLDIEEGRKRVVKRGFVRDICAFYKTDRVLIEHLVKLADATYMDDWTDAYAGVIDKDGWLYLQREERASRAVFHDSTAIPSLIQPRSYVEVILRTTKVSYDDAEAEWDQTIRFREARRSRWLKSRRSIVCLIGEAAFAVDLGAQANDELRQHVLELSTLPFADIRVIPFAAGRYDLMGWEVNVLEFGEGEEPFIRVASPRGAGFVSAHSHRGKFFRGGVGHARDLSVPVREFFK
ncbi:Scr1 family TA system antitoxin-like transcriptional regulator [Stackebrandtia nassauensis]|uniref:DUF5753 domain-containing protein n=1 Tax=Stackebrandtia nassauensis (strain DSM 44728 / CIP 108903 / NRRL B-16338 / NBRC 102104 / LLR-40K-21) TaxID=446470 RepID=D3Q886_STANL|nr:Scr1 family TA system antitoxin-like transcriptional regulator [Stackebrandtia nassauensis]ADD42460.1 hypothetical protein Snas_2784 [Stackebrandtia nassauensis DSM 44728]